MDDSEYQQTESILRGQHRVPDRIAAFLEWIRSRFDVDAINVSFGTAGYHQGVSIILKRNADAGKMYDPAINASVIIAEWYYQNFYPFVPSDSEKAHGEYVTPVPGKRAGVGLSYYSMESEVCKRVFKKVKPDVHTFKEKYKDLIENVTELDTEILIFFYTEAQESECAKNGTLARMLEELVAPLKALDEFNLLTGKSLHGCLRIDNKENFDKNYGGQMWSYMR